MACRLRGQPHLPADSLTALRPSAATPSAAAEAAVGAGDQDSRWEADTVRKLIYSMNTTLDGYIAARGDDIGWSVPSVELHQWFNVRARGIGVSLYGRKCGR